MYDRTERVYGINLHALCTKIVMDSDSPISRKKKLFYHIHFFFRKLDLYTLGWCNLLPVLYSVTFLMWNADVADDSAVPKVKSNYKTSHNAPFVMWHDPCRKFQLFVACFSYGSKEISSKKIRLLHYVHLLALQIFIRKWFSPNLKSNILNNVFLCTTSTV